MNNSPQRIHCGPFKATNYNVEGRNMLFADMAVNQSLETGAEAVGKTSCCTVSSSV